MSEQLSSDKLHCSFCGKDQDKVLKLIAGPTVYICDECIDLCNDIIAEEVAEDPGESPPKPRPTGLEHIAACVVCRQPKLLEDVFTDCSAGPVCRTCARAIEGEVRLDATYSLVDRMFCALCGRMARGDLLEIGERGAMCGTCVETVLNAARVRQP